MRNVGPCWRVFLLAGLLLSPRGELRADGGALSLSERKGDYQITVFTSPTPLRAGPVDVSVLVQDPRTGDPVLRADVLVRVTPRGRPGETISRPATTEAATNKLFRAAVFDLPEPGLWDVEVVVVEARGAVEVRFETRAEESRTPLGEVAPWIAWPAAVIFLFGVHQWLTQRRARDFVG